ncbi:hypothetical protein HDU98_001868 [Podochytrium sp. JEL0797]|nr:hypothetical protein HDU98_001868 [Podochytrium sp. JEL0797]
MFDWAVADVLRPNDFVILLHIRAPSPAPLEDPITPTDDTPSPSIDNTTPDPTLQALSILTPFAKRLTSLGLKYQALPIISPRIKESLVLTAVDKIYADLLIIGSRGESVGSSLEPHEMLESSQVLGSVAQFCVKHCACPLLMFKPNAADMIDLILRPFVMARWVKAGRVS